ncbi:MAG: class I SAM-dependent methyltransferase [Dehalococcoidia bacterium]
MIAAESHDNSHLIRNDNPFNSFAQDYDAWFEDEGRLIFSIEAYSLRELATPSPSPKLEIGVGTGRFAEAIGIDCGIDPSAKALAIGKKEGINLIQAMGEKAPFINRAFGTAVLITTLCFVGSGRQVLEEAGRVLRDEGKILLGLILKDSPWGKLYENKKAQGHPVYQNAFFRSYDEVAELLGNAGFRIDRVMSTLFQPPGEVKEFEYPREGYQAGAGFLGILAGKAEGN